ncbi:MAG: hypothetical protein WC480_02750 [Patescibacteria group bacterium]
MEYPPSETLDIKAKLKNNGLDIFVGNKKFAIDYPTAIWQKTPSIVRQALLENITFAETHLLPLILNKKKIKYNFNYPLFEPYLFKNQLYDLIYCEKIDEIKKPLSYLQKFYNLDFEFSSPDSTIPGPTDIPKLKFTKTKAIIPFTFGKESLVTFSLCRELGIEPILFYCQEPVQPYEEKYKLKRLAELEKKFKVKTYFIKHEPGLFRYGRAFNTPAHSELGWGSQTTILALLAIPFLYAEQARYILFSSEASTAQADGLINGWKVFNSADETIENSILKNNICRLLTNNQSEVKCLLEPLEEIEIFYLLHHRYPEIGQQQFSCFAEKPLYPGSQWCHNCTKCQRMFVFARACGLDPQKIGFKKDILQSSGYFKHYFDNKDTLATDQELDFIFYLLSKKGLTSPYIKKFQKERLPKLRSWNWYHNYYSGIKSSINLPAPYRNKIIKIFSQEMANFEKRIS